MSTTPYAAATWPLVSGRTTLLHIDLQNDFLSLDGWYAKKGVDVSHMRRCIEPVKQLNAAARAKGIPIVWTRHGSRGLEDGGPFMALRPFLHDGGLRQDTWGYELLEELGPQPEDWYVEKMRLSAFFGTNLEIILRSLGTETLIVTGVLTNQCVGATTKDALFRDFKPIVIEEATGTTMPHLHDPIIECIRNGWGVVRGIDEVLGEIGSLSAAA